MSTAVVIPCIRSVSDAVVEHIPDDVMIYVVNDHGYDMPIIVPQRKNLRVLTYTDQDNDFSHPKRQALLSRKTDACRNYGIWKAYKDGADVIINLDDDVHMPEGWIKRYEDILDGKATTINLETEGVWINTLESSLWFARGFPYQDRVNYNFHYGNTIKKHPLVHMGMWSGVLDINGMDKVAATVQNLSIPANTWTGTEILDPGEAYIPLCAMNCGAKRQAALGLMQVPMAHQFYRHFKMYRAGDIWGGILWQTLFPDTTTFGDPVGVHTKSGNLNWEMWGENYANILAKEFERIIQNAAYETHLARKAVNTQAEAYWMLGDMLGTMVVEKEIEPHFIAFMKGLSESLITWAEAFE